MIYVFSFAIHDFRKIKDGKSFCVVFNKTINNNQKNPVKMNSIKLKSGIFFICFTMLFPGKFLYAQEQDVLVLKKGLMIRSARVYRGSYFQSNPVESKIILGTWTAPKEGDEVIFNDTTVNKWETVTAGENGWFHNRAFRGAYIYFPVDMDYDQVFLLEGMSHQMVYVNGIPRSGNPYQRKEMFESWEPQFNYSLIPVALNKGNNDLLFKCSGRLKVNLHKPWSDIMLNVKDKTIPDLIVGETTDTWGAVVVINTTSKPLDDLKIVATWEGNNQAETLIPVIQPLSIRKVGFKITGKSPAEAGETELELKLVRADEKEDVLLDEGNIVLKKVNPLENHKRTFLSHIDGSVQYYAINPAQEQDKGKNAALVLSVHGAAVEAINQANSYYSKSWAHIVAPTNRRPYGYNWEDWGRLDALEVLEIAKNTLNIDPNRIYLTGHSMGGHGTWILGAIYPDQFAAIGPSAGWLSFWSYRIRERVETGTPMEKMLMRATLPSNTFALSDNYNQFGIYVIHGSDDDNVSVEQSRRMVKHLSTFHKDYIYHEEKDAGHWWNKSDEPGADCVDWPPLFDFFARHARPGNERIRKVDFVTASPGISASCYWLEIGAQIKHLELSKANIQYDPGKNRFIGTTENVARLVLDVNLFSKEKKFIIDLDSQKIENIIPDEKAQKIWLEQHEGKWSVAGKPSRLVKGPQRYGTFKDAFKNNVVFVYGTNGNVEEDRWSMAKARYDAEIFWYQGNASVHIIPDTEFNPAEEINRNVVLYGNATTNMAWKKLLGESPVNIEEGRIVLGERKFKGDDLACLLIRPRPGSSVASVGAVSGTGITGMRLTNNLRYLYSGFGFPDCLVFSSEVLEKGNEGVKAAGFFGIDWSIEKGEFVFNE